jgi:hypothetical protein
MVSTRRSFLELTTTTLAASLLASRARADTSQIIVPVVGASSPTRDIALGTLRRIFLGDLVDGAAGQRYVPFNHPPLTRPRSVFDQAVLSMNPDEVARYWVDQRIRFGTRPPRTVPGIPLLRQVLARLPGAVSYVTQADLDSSVRALTIDGQGPESPRYPLR